MQNMTASLRRINRAKKHLNILSRDIKSFLASRPYRCEINKDPLDGNLIFSPYLIQELPISWGFLVGEVAHGLRSALDNIAWELAIKKDEFTSFPIYIERNSKLTQKLNRLRDDIREEVIAVQPYKILKAEKRKHPLWILSRVDNIDKHRLILPCLSKIFVATGLEHPKWFYIDGFIHLYKGNVIFKRLINPSITKDFKPEIRGQIIFDISSPPVDQNDPTRLTLRDLFIIHDFIRNEVYPRFAQFLKPEKRSS